MKWEDFLVTWWWLPVVVLFAAALVFAPIRVELSYTHMDHGVGGAGADDTLDVRVRAMYVVRYDRRVALGDTGVRADRLSDGPARGAPGSAWRAAGDFLQDIAALRRLLRAFEIRDIDWSTTVGAPFAPDAAILCGVLWTVKSTVVGAASQVLTLSHTPRMSITPRFDRPVLATRASCIVTTRLGKATYAGWRLFLLVKKTLVTVAKEGVHAGSSDSISHADSHGEP